MSTLVIIPCGQSKIWDKDPTHPPTPAVDAYTGAPFKVNRAYAQQIGDQWLILSAKHGFMWPGFIIPENYDVCFTDPKSGPVDLTVLRQQAKALKLNSFTKIIGLGGQAYRERIVATFAGMPPSLHFPFAGLPIGKAMAAVKAALTIGQSGVPDVPVTPISAEPVKATELTTVSERAGEWQGTSAEFRLASIISWNIAAEVVCRHGSHGEIGIGELYKFSNVNSCLTLFRGGWTNAFVAMMRPGGLHMFGDFNGQRRRLNDPPWDRWADEGRLEYAAAYSAMGDLRTFVWELEDVLGLPSTRGRPAPLTTRNTLAARLLARLVARFYAASEGWLHVYSAAGSPSGNRDWHPDLEQFPRLFGRVRTLSDGPLRNCLAQIWLLRLIHTPEPGSNDGPLLAAIDTESQLYLLSHPDEPEDLYAQYDAHKRKITSLALDVESKLVAIWESFRNG